MIDEMTRINRILNHDLYIECLNKLELEEKDRRFCRHNMNHFLDVARIAMIINLQEGMGQDRELIYGAGLLHDIGRHLQYTEGIPHEEAGGELAPGILRDCGFNESETSVIVKAIRNHRNKEIRDEKSLSGILYRADKMSRPCFSCDARQECHKDGQEKKQGLIL